MSRAARAGTGGKAGGGLPRGGDSRSASARWLLAPIALLLAVSAVGCTAEAGTTPTAQEQPSPFASCTGLASRPSNSPNPRAAGPVLADLPDLVLPCFSGGSPVRLADLRGPAVLNLWASWCEPCRAELPAMQRLADRTAGRLHVVGVDTGDARDAAASFGADTGVTLPTLYDRDRQLVGALGRASLPVTVFVATGGKRYVYDRLPLDDAELARLVRDHTGVTVTP